MTNTNTTALLLTQYAKHGSIGEDEYIQYYIDEEFIPTDRDIDEYNAYLKENCYGGYYDDLSEMLDGLPAEEAVRATYFGHFEYNAKYHCFNGFGYIDSYDEREIIAEMKRDTDFLTWYIDRNSLVNFNDEEVKNAIAAANELIKKGY